ncbi:MAG: CDP-glycerol glycerophosphotransferase family protein [Clostridia bacterium]|nr:CDP-glycerol glycerophosphotransferase family protein [Clostridia bacterium]
MNIQNFIPKDLDVKELAFTAYAAVFNLAAKLPVKKNRVILFSLYDANFNDALGEIQMELLRRDPRKAEHNKATNSAYNIIRVDRNDLFRSKQSLVKFMTWDAFRAGRAKYIFLNNNFMAMGKMNPNPETEIVQVWHGMGAFKKFGYDMPQPEDIRRREIGANKNLTRVVCTSPGVAPYYMSAFGVTEDKIISTGSPNQDWYFRKRNAGPESRVYRRLHLNSLYPQAEDKYLVLYAPTFRDDPNADSILAHVDFAKMKESLEKGLNKKMKPEDKKREVCILVRLHPHDEVSRKSLEGLKGSEVLRNSVADATDYPDANALCLMTDLLITDYSSICMGTVLINKPVVFYAYDLDSYNENRSFYYDYESTVPGPVAHNMNELGKVLRAFEFREDKRLKFRTMMFGDDKDINGDATKKMLDQIL